MLFIRIAFYFLAIFVIAHKAATEFTHAGAYHSSIAMRTASGRIVYLTCH